MLMTTTQIEQLFSYNTERLNKWRNVTVSNIPWLEHYTLIRSKYYATGVIMPSDVEFLQYLADHDIRKLKHKAYLQDTWYDINPKKVKQYNLLKTAELTE
jgi:hypothetical protein